MMIFKDSHIPAQAHKRLAKLLAEMFPNAEALPPAKDTTAYVLCSLRSWRDMATAYSSEVEPTPLDEDCGHKAFVVRRAEQAERLREFFAEHGHPLDTNTAAQLMSRWQPSARRPKESVALYYESQAKGQSTGTEKFCLQLLQLLQLLPRVPSEADVKLFLANIRFSDKAWTERIQVEAGIVATYLVNQRTNPAAAIGMRMLEALVAGGFNYARVSLAKALAFGWGDENHGRAWGLAHTALTEKFLARDSYIELYKVIAWLSINGNKVPRNKRTALAMYLRAAALGDGPAALIASHYYLPLPAGHERDEFSDVVRPNKERAEKLFHLALARGYNPSTKQFPLEA
ncbi:hypothetical protein [Paraburkholderia sp. 40]|uniref:hypothetical protein n=1 Tax=Paraburkholderia sp. 40 TaxID=2991059 RepID=UPI003D1E3B52